MGNDTITGDGKDDQLFGGAGDDVIYGDNTEANLAGQFHGSDFLDGEDGTKAFTLYLSVPAAVGKETKTIATNHFKSCGEAIFCLKTDAANDGWMRRVA